MRDVAAAARQRASARDSSRNEALAAAWARASEAWAALSESETAAGKRGAQEALAAHSELAEQVAKTVADALGRRGGPATASPASPASPASSASPASPVAAEAEAEARGQAAASSAGWAGDGDGQGGQDDDALTFAFYEPDWIASLSSQAYARGLRISVVRRPTA